MRDGPFQQTVFSTAVLALSIRPDLVPGGFVLYALAAAVLIWLMGPALPSSPTRLLIVMVVLASSLISASDSTDRTRSLGWFLLVTLALGVWSSASASDKRVKEYSVVALTVCGAVHAVLSLLDVTLTPAGGADGHGLTQYYLQSAYFVMLGTVAAVILLSEAAGPRARILLVALLLDFGALLALSSRAALGWALLASIILIVQGRLLRGSVARKFSIVLGLAVTIGGASWLIGFSRLRERLETMSSAGLIETRREQFQDLALRVALDNPWGVGWNGFSAFTGGYLGETVRSAHSLYLGLALSMGMVGALVTLVSLAVSTFRSIVDSDVEVRRFGVMGVLILGHGLTDDITVYPPMIVVLGLLMGCITRKLPVQGIQGRTIDSERIRG